MLSKVVRYFEISGTLSYSCLISKGFIAPSETYDRKGFIDLLADVLLYMSRMVAFKFTTEE